MEHLVQLAINLVLLAGWCRLVTLGEDQFTRVSTLIAPNYMKN